MHDIHFRILAEKFHGAESTHLKYLNNASNRHRSFAIALPYVKNTKLFPCRTIPIYGNAVTLHQHFHASAYQKLLHAALPQGKVNHRTSHCEINYKIATKLISLIMLNNLATCVVMQPNFLESLCASRYW